METDEKLLTIALGLVLALMTIGLIWRLSFMPG